MKDSFERVFSDLGDQYLYAAEQERSRLMEKLKRDNKKRLKVFLILAAVCALLIMAADRFFIPYISAVSTIENEQRKREILGEKETLDLKAERIIETAGKEIARAIEETDCRFGSDYYLKAGERSEVRIYLIFDAEEKVIGMLMIDLREGQECVSLCSASDNVLEVLQKELAGNPGTIHVLFFRNGLPAYIMEEESGKLIKINREVNQ